VRCRAGCWELGRGRARGCAAGTGSTSSSGRQMERDGCDASLAVERQRAQGQPGSATRQHPAVAAEQQHGGAETRPPSACSSLRRPANQRRRVRMARALSSLCPLQTGRRPSTEPTRTSTHDTTHDTRVSSGHNAGAASATEAVAVGLHDARACAPSLFQTRAGPGGITPVNAKLGHDHHHRCHCLGIPDCRRPDHPHGFGFWPRPRRRHAPRHAPLRRHAPRHAPLRRQARCLHPEPRHCA
jgi:hypothetical protein